MADSCACAVYLWVRTQVTSACDTGLLRALKPPCHDSAERRQSHSGGIMLRHKQCCYNAVESATLLALNKMRNLPAAQNCLLSGRACREPRARPVGLSNWSQAHNLQRQVQHYARRWVHSLMEGCAHLPFISSAEGSSQASIRGCAPFVL
jgi:hypothetical protein